MKEDPSVLIKGQEVQSVCLIARSTDHTALTVITVKEAPDLETEEVQDHTARAVKVMGALAEQGDLAHHPTVLVEEQEHQNPEDLALTERGGHIALAEEGSAPLMTRGTGTCQTPPYLMPTWPGRCPHPLSTINTNSLDPWPPQQPLATQTLLRGVLWTRGLKENMELKLNMNKLLQWTSLVHLLDFQQFQEVPHSIHQPCPQVGHN